MKKQNGITLIALVITIIVMLILVGVSVTVALNGGLFTIAKDAANETKIKRDEELKLSEGKVQINGEWYDSINEYVNGAGENSGGSTSEVTFWLYNGNTGEYDTFTAPSDATWGDIWDIVPNMSEDYSEYFLFSDEELAFGASTCFSCPNSEFGTHYITKDTLIIDAPMPHLGMLHRNDNFDVCWIEDCTNYNSSSIPAGD